MDNELKDSQPLHPISCADLKGLIERLGPSSDESRNASRGPLLSLIQAPDCIEKPYPGTQGAQKWIITIILITFLIFGLIGNILSASIMFRRARRGLSSYFYLALLAVVDICVLYTGCITLLFEIAFDYHPELTNAVSCRLISYIQHLFTYISAWLIIAVTFERFIVVGFPFQSIRICRMHVAYTVTLIIFVIFAIYTSHYFFTLDIIHISIQTDHGFHPDYSICDLIVRRRLFAFLDLCLYSVLPSLLIIIFNIFIIYTMFYAIKQRSNFLQGSSCVPTLETSPRNLNQKNKSLSSIRTQFFRSRSVESSPACRSYISHGRVGQNVLSKTGVQNNSQQILFDSTSATGIRLTCLLLLISFVFVLCTLPISLRVLIADLFPPNKSTLAWQITQMSLSILMYFNHTINFVLYCLTGRAFRNECRKILRDIWALKDIHISCTVNPETDKEEHYPHQQIMLTDRTRMIVPPGQRMKRSHL